VGERLSYGSRSEGASGIAVAANRTREIRPSGMRGGLAETWANGWKKSNRHVVVACDEAFNESQLLRYSTGGRARRISIPTGEGRRKTSPYPIIPLLRGNP
jgi:hypothetical protein